MAKLNVSLDEDIREELFNLIPPGKRSQVINKVLRKELIRRRRKKAAARLKQLRSQVARYTGTQILMSLREARSRSAS